MSVTGNVKELIKEFNSTNLTKLRFTSSEFNLILERGYGDISQQVEFIPNFNAINNQSVNKEQVTIDSPMVGTFYVANSPKSKPFVNIGSRVAKGDIVCIIEAMKLMNEVESDQDGVIKEILVEDGELVEFGTPLFVIE
ncbi:acetyl-CoA carboxylase, biotin carboxyl carrier protein [Candidatus Epulonipiscium fishelsonii]|uniref:Acetyl-CoA carboxylase, biotin carboxyl carrier protein n=1 Tax=Candidatus Epulonipiscium fishelsonii TaxID=77094 RepID=A0ACC8XB48_9FIRM|nr:acetyl-CoA carboxylase, biotin carboxyl carrier protein [Epulopiscium sp. SCG-B11WGA-EpuloA1]ONI41986.1 acetyl-CoA carboxylase, biotin carboxyl carrier protein [Epulopiscium sp. SCG-B05WGA-EpuloA1]ONI47215.1 acetyl-CoA carboxylase, biotin carboxyl carrier protein [Epulopiscium sp. SCG-C06WGA-EpuloA1]